MATDTLSPPAPTGLWAGWDLNIAFWVDGAWIRLVPRAPAGWSGSLRKGCSLSGPAALGRWWGEPRDVSGRRVQPGERHRSLEEGDLFAGGDQHGHDAQLLASQYLVGTGDPCRDPDLHREQDLLGHADRLGNGDDVSGATATIGTSTGTATYGMGTGATTTGVTKTVNLGTGGAYGLTTVVNIGSATAGAGGTTVINTPTVTFANAVTQVGMPQANLTAQLWASAGPRRTVTTGFRSTRPQCC